jgi:hypothetical protein
MSVATVKPVVVRFLTSETPEVLALKGAWGVGKTFAWKRLVQEKKDEIALPRYCYVSLFGIASLSELQTAIFAKSRDVKSIDADFDLVAMGKRWKESGSDLFAMAAGFLGTLKKAPYLNNVSIALDAIAPHLISKTIVCLDDFERLSSQLRVDELLGFISSLKEEKNCKVVLIFSEENLEAVDTYKGYREKVVDKELQFAPTSDEAAELAFPPTLPHRNLAKKYSTALGITNIRVLRKIVQLIELIEEEIGGFHRKIMEQAVNTIVLIAWSYYEANGKKPTFEFILNWNSLQWGLGQEAGKEEDPRHAGWIKRIREYGLTHTDEFDLAIVKIVQRGYLEDSGLRDEASKLDAQVRASELEHSFSSAWSLFHDTFASNEAELIQAMNDSFRRSVHFISPVNLNGTVRLLRQLDHGHLADEFIDFYIENRSNETRLFDLNASPFSRDINDAVIRDRFERKHREHQKIPSLLETARHIADTGSWEEGHVQALEQATENDFFDLFKSIQGEELRKIVKACLRFEGPGTYEAVGRKVHGALNRIGKESKLNAERVKRYGIVFDSDNDVLNS